MPAAGADFFGNFEKVPVGEFEKKNSDLLYLYTVVNAVEKFLQ